VTRRLTLKNVASVLKGWPQAISADDGDLRVLHDMANSSAGEWGESLFWPDYLWLSLDRPESPVGEDDVEAVRVYVKGPAMSQPDANLGEFKRQSVRSIAGLYPVSNRIECLIELKAILVDHMPKLRRYKPGAPWPKFLHTKLRQAFSHSLAHADQQIRDRRRLLPLGEARGVTVIVNEKSPSLDLDMVQAFLASEIQRFRNIDAVVYLCDRSKRHCLAVVQKDQYDAVIRHFSEDFSLMFNNVVWDTKIPTISGGPYPQRVVRIEMDERSRVMYRTWSTGWRVVDDPTSTPVPTIRMQIVPASEFRSGLA
jgi:hypothetical protein